MAERSHAPPSRATFFVGIVLVTIAAALVAFVFAKAQRKPDAGTLVYAGSGGIYEHNLNNGDDAKITSIPKDISVAEPSPDGRFVAYANTHGQLWMYDIRAKRRYTVADSATIPIGWSPDSKLVARELVGNGDVVLIDPNAGRKGLMNGGPVTLSLPVWINSSRVAIGDTANPDGSMLVDTQGSEKPVVNAKFGVPLAASPDGTELLSLRDNAVQVGRVEPDGVKKERVVFHGAATVAAASSQGFLAITGKDQSGRSGIWVLETGTELKRVEDQAADWMVFTRDGGTIVYAQDGALYALTLKTHRTERLSRRGVTALSVLSFRVVPSS